MVYTNLSVYFRCLAVTWEVHLVNEMTGCILMWWSLVHSHCCYCDTYLKSTAVYWCHPADMPHLIMLAGRWLMNTSNTVVDCRTTKICHTPHLNFSPFSVFIYLTSSNLVVHWLTVLFLILHILSHCRMFKLPFENLIKNCDCFVFSVKNLRGRVLPKIRLAL